MRFGQPGGMRFLRGGRDHFMIALPQKRRVMASIIISLAFNCLLLIISFVTDPRGGRPNFASGIVEILGLPGGVAAAALAGGEHGGAAQLLVMIASLILFYAVVAWLILRLCVRSPEGHPRL